MTVMMRLATILVSAVFMAGCAQIDAAGRGTDAGAAAVVNGAVVALGPAASEAPLIDARMASHSWELADRAESRSLIGWIDDERLRVSLSYRKGSRYETERMVTECKDNKPLWTCGAIWDLDSRLLGIAPRPVADNDPLIRPRGVARPAVPPDDYARVFGVSVERCCGRSVDQDGTTYYVVSPLARTPHGAIVRAYKKDGTKPDFSKISNLLDTGTQRYLLLAGNGLQTSTFISSPNGCRQAIEYARDPKAKRKLVYMDICAAAEAGAFLNRSSVEARNEGAKASPRNW